MITTIHAIARAHARQRVILCTIAVVIYYYYCSQLILLLLFFPSIRRPRYRRTTSVSRLRAPATLVRHRAPLARIGCPFRFYRTRIDPENRVPGHAGLGRRIITPKLRRRDNEWNTITISRRAFRRGSRRPLDACPTDDTTAVVGRHSAVTAAPATTRHQRFDRHVVHTLHPRPPVICW